MKTYFNHIVRAQSSQKGLLEQYEGYIQTKDEIR